VHAILASFGMIFCALLPMIMANTNKLLHQFRVVAVGPQQPGNVGMIARACANFDCDDLALVAPEYDRLEEESASYERRFAVQSHALSLLRNAPVHAGLEQALSGCAAAVAFTRRRGSDRQQSYLPVGKLAELAAKAGDGRVALVFGREDSGLKQSELLQCSHYCEIPTSAIQGSMSLPAAAVFALGRCFEEALAMEESGDFHRFNARQLGGDTTSVRAVRNRPTAIGHRHDSNSMAMSGRDRLATLDEISIFMRRWEQLASHGEVGLHGDGALVRTSRGTRTATSQGKASVLLRRMLQRAQLTGRELRALHGALRSLEEKNAV